MTQHTASSATQKAELHCCCRGQQLSPRTQRGSQQPCSSHDQHTPLVSVGFPLGGTFPSVSMGFLDAGGLTGIMMS